MGMSQSGNLPRERFMGWKYDYKKGCLFPNELKRYVIKASDDITTKLKQVDGVTFTRDSLIKPNEKYHYVIIPDQSMDVVMDMQEVRRVDFDPYAYPSDDSPDLFLMAWEAECRRANGEYDT